MSVFREGKTLKLKATIPEETAMDASRLSELLGGASLGEIAQGHPLYGRIHGIQVNKVQANTPASRAGLRPGDIISSVNRQPIQSLDEFEKAATGARQLLLNVRRGNQAFFLMLR